MGTRTLLHGICTQSDTAAVYVPRSAEHKYYRNKFSSVIKFKNCEILTIVSTGDIPKLLKKMKNSFPC